MAQPAYLKDLKEYTRRQLGGTSATPTMAVAHLANESDRGAVILASTSVEDMLEWAITARLPNLMLDTTARDAMFGSTGSLQTFSSKIAMAYALGVLDKDARRVIDLIREMRNACAHARLPLSFNEAVLRDICRQVVSEMLPYMVDSQSPGGLRHCFVLKCTFLCQYLITGTHPNFIEEVRAVQAAAKAVDPT
jgi:hypothetical protein